MIEPFFLSNKFLRKYKLRNPKEFNYKVRMTLDYFEDYLFFVSLERIFQNILQEKKFINIYLEIKI